MRGYIVASISLLCLVQGLSLADDIKPEKLEIRLGVDEFLKDFNSRNSPNDKTILKVEVIEIEEASKLEATNTAETNPAANSTNQTDSSAAKPACPSNSTTGANSTSPSNCTEQPEAQADTLIYGIYADIVIVVVIIAFILISVLRDRSNKAAQEPGYTKVAN